MGPTLFTRASRLSRTMAARLQILAERGANRQRLRRSQFVLLLRPARRRGRSRKINGDFSVGWNRGLGPVRPARILPLFLQPNFSGVKLHWPHRLEVCVPPLSDYETASAETRARLPVLLMVNPNENTARSEEFLSIPLPAARLLGAILHSRVQCRYERWPRRRAEFFLPQRSGL
jgi:hypothetical protein